MTQGRARWFHLLLHRPEPRGPARQARPTQRVGAGVACLDDAARVLMVRRRDNGHWDLPGGGVQPGERIGDAARRELLEETGLAARDVRLLDVFSGLECRFTYPDGNVVDWVTLLYVARAWRGTPRAADDAVDARFWPLTAPPAPLGAATQRYLAALMAGGSG